MTRSVLYLIIIGALVTIAVWLSLNPGTVSLEWFGWRIEVAVGFVIGALAVLLIGAVLLVRFVGGVLGAPGDFLRRRGRRRREKGYRALTLGLAAVAAGDADEASRQARKANDLLREPALTNLLSAQAASLKGDAEAAARYFQSLTRADDTEFSGLIGLLRLAMQQGDAERTQQLAERAYAIRQDSAFVMEVLFDLHTANGRWAEAQSILTRMAQRGVVTDAVARRHRTALATERAEEALAMERTGEALEHADAALSATQGFVPAVVARAHALKGIGKPRRAHRHLEEAFGRGPHPDLARAYLDTADADDQTPRFKRLQRLVAGDPGHPVSRAALARAAAEVGDLAEARRLLESVPAPDRTAQIYHQLAWIEEVSEGGSLAKARAYLEQAALCPAEEGWTCERCGATATRWSALCGNCGDFDTIAWKAPPRVVPEVSEPIAAIEVMEEEQKAVTAG